VKKEAITGLRAAGTACAKSIGVSDALGCLPKTLGYDPKEERNV
jgi:hypothetical protein